MSLKLPLVGAFLILSGVVPVVYSGLNVSATQEKSKSRRCTAELKSSYCKSWTKGTREQFPQ